MKVRAAIGRTERGDWALVAASDLADTALFQKAVEALEGHGRIQLVEFVEIDVPDGPATKDLPH